MFTQTLENHHAGPVSEALEPAPHLLLPGKSPVCLWKVSAQPRRFSGWVKGALRVWSWETRASPLRSPLLTAQVGGKKVSNLWPPSPHYKTLGMDLTGCAPPGPGPATAREQDFATVSRIPSTRLITYCASEQPCLVEIGVPTFSDEQTDTKRGMIP